MMHSTKEVLRIGIMAGIALILSCTASKKNGNPQKKYPVPVLQQDYLLFQQILEKNHPGIYSYTSKGEMDFYFKEGYRQLNDSMTEPAFRKVLAYVIAKLNCGHTVTKYSKNYSKYLSQHRQTLLPFSIKFLEDTAVIADNINRSDSTFSRGAVLHSMNGVPINSIRDSLSQFIASDGFNKGHKWQLLNSRNIFSAWYKLAYQPDSLLQLSFTDSTGIFQHKTISIGATRRDSTRDRGPVANSPRRALPLLAYNEKLLAVDTSFATAYMVVNTFATGNHLKTFFRKSFRTLKKQKIKNLIIDVRYNGGGNVSNSNLLTRLLVNKPYKLADSLYAVSKTYYKAKHIQYHLWQWPLMTVITKKHADGLYHFGYYERHFFKPKKKNHFNGKVYIITGYNSFSATSIFANTLKGQDNILLVGEETGGGRYGNNAWLVPDVTLPQTGVRFTLPKFKLVMNKNLPNNGRGVPVDVEAAPNRLSIQNGIDVKMRKVGELMRKHL